MEVRGGLGGLGRSLYGRVISRFLPFPCLFLSPYFPGWEDGKGGGRESYPFFLGGGLFGFLKT